MLAERLPCIDGMMQVLYQTPKSTSGLVVTMNVYRPDRTKDEVQSGTGVEIGTTGRYYLMFNADGPGWFVLVHDNAGGSAVKQF
jgi:hypothetical protein